MGVERRRAGFRLPWGPDGETSEEATATVTDGADDSARPADETSSSMNGSAASEPMAAEGDSAEFLKSLVGAMRSVAETSRDASLSELRTAIDARIRAVNSEATRLETDIRGKAESDLEGIGEWERTELDRIRTEAESRRDARRTKLEEDLAQHRVAAERAVEVARARLEQHENELAAFFSQLGEITDPAAFVAAAKRMPRAPELEGTSAVDTEPNAGAEPMVAEKPAEADADTSEGSTDWGDPELAAATETAEATDAAEATQVAEVAEGEDAQPVTAPANVEGNGASAPEDAHLAERLAQLDERLADSTPPATPAPPVATATAGGDTSTAIIVKGLGSFGAITSFKQSLERVEGVRGVTLSLGPTGEFVYRASHAADFDIQSAITSIEGPAASIEDTEGTLVVTLSRGR